jgi:chromosomal replication initiation ATPase DnaA
VSPTQLPLDLPHRRALGRDDFLVAPSNAAAVAWVDRWPDWPFPVLVLHGPVGSGKTHLAQVWRHMSGATDDVTADAPSVLVDDAAQAAGDAAREEALFHLIERIKARGGHLLLTGRAPPARWALGLADLRSRLNAAMVVAIEQPDDALLAGVALKLFADRQLDVSVDALDALLARVERSVDGVARAVAAIDRAALAAKRRVTAPLVRDVLTPRSA